MVATGAGLMIDDHWKKVPLTAESGTYGPDLLVPAVDGPRHMASPFPSQDDSGDHPVDSERGR